MLLFRSLSEFLQDAQGIAKQCLAVRVAGEGTIGRQERLTVGDGEAGSKDRLGEAFLHRAGEGHQCVRETDRKPSCVHRAVECRTEPLGQGVAFARPRSLTPQELGGGAQRESVVVDQRGDDPRLVHGGDGLAGSVGLQKERLGVLARLLDHDGEVLQAGLLSGAEPLEAVDHLEALGLLAGGDHAKRQLCEAVVTRGDVRSERGVGCPEFCRGNELDRVGHCYSLSAGSSERTW